MGASVDVGDGYASNFLVVNPQEKLTEGDKKFSVTMKVDASMSGTVTVYKADANSPQWRKVDADIDDGVAKMQVDSGMCYLYWITSAVSCTSKTHNMFKVEENNIEQFFVTHIVTTAAGSKHVQ